MFQSHQEHSLNEIGKFLVNWVMLQQQQKYESIPRDQYCIPVYIGRRPLAVAPWPLDESSETGKTSIRSTYGTVPYVIHTVWWGWC